MIAFSQAGYDFEHSEFLLYQNMVLQESGAYDDALKHLQSNKDQIYDKVTIHETLGANFELIHCFLLESLLNFQVSCFILLFRKFIFEAW